MRSKNKHIAFGWYGGKYSHLDWLLPLLPKAHHYCEPFGGSAAVLINREQAPVETYNDLDSEVVNFFQVLRTQKEELLYAIGLTPFSREEYLEAIYARNGKRGSRANTAAPRMNRLLESPSAYAELESAIGMDEDGDETAFANEAIDHGTSTGLEPLTELERARLFFVRARQSRTGLAQTASVGRWANCLNTSRAGMAGAVSRWLGSVPELEWVASRLLSVQIEHDDALAVIRRYDSPGTLFYCDPPYPHGTRGDAKAYQYEMTDHQHVELHHLLSAVQGKVAISGYHGALMDELYSDWNVHEEGARQVHSVKQDRVEVLWTNY